jgi:hypothetical protein
MELDHFPPSEFESRNLTKEEIANPYLLIQELFQYGHLPEIRDQLWTILSTCVAGDYCSTLNDRERSNLVYFLHLTGRVFEALYLIYKQKRVA